MRNFDDSLIRILDKQQLSPLPDLFTMQDGTAVTSPAQWEKRRKEIFRTAVEMQYGTLPPEPEFLEAEPLDSGTDIRSFRITTGTKKNPVSFIMRLILPDGRTDCPVLVDGDLCWRYFFDKDFIHAAAGRNIMLALFNRTEIVPDRADAGKNGQLYKAYPDRSFGAIAAWAWGYSRCVDALEKLGIGDLTHIAFTGHSRGGKTALLAGVLDERASVVNPNDSGAGGAGCYRVHMKAQQESGEEQRSEQLSDLIRNFPHWFGPEMAACTEKEGELPFDEHFLKALIAPRILLETNAASDIWANPVGSFLTSEAAGEVYRFLGKPENRLFYYRKGCHEHHISDLSLLLDVFTASITGKAFPEGSRRLPFRMTDDKGE